MNSLKWWRLGLACALIVNAATPAGAQDLSVTARLEAGLDPATRDFITHLPGNWGPQIASIVENTLDQFHSSITQYVTLLDDFSSRKMAELKCTVVTTPGDIVDDLARRLPWVSHQDGKMEKLDFYITEEFAKPKFSSSPHQIDLIYDDIMMAASMVTCSPGHDITAGWDTRKIIDKYTNKWLVWNRLESIGCPSIVECLSAYKKVVGDIVHNSNPNDVAKSHALEAFNAFRDPDPPTYWSNWISFSAYEASFSELYRIENSIGTAQALREVSAIRVLETAKVATNGAQEQIAAIRWQADHALINGTISCDAWYPVFNAARSDGSEDEQTKRFSKPQGAFYWPRTTLVNAKKTVAIAFEQANITKEAGDTEIARISGLLNRMKDAYTFCHL